MKRPLKPEELRLWGLVAATVHPLPGKATPPAPAPAPAGLDRPAERVSARVAAAPSSPRLPGSGLGPAQLPRDAAQKGIEPRRRRRIARDRDPIGPRLDLHGLDQDRARAVLEHFLRRAWTDGYRAVLVITGKGLQGDGVLRRRAPEWLAAAHLAPIVAGISEAHRRHGGEGALYVALKRKPKD
jgi:DNA-nicking Smr family endonuclease